MSAALRLVSSRLPVPGLLQILLVFGAQCLLATFSGSHQIAWMVQAAVLVFMAGYLAVGCLLREDPQGQRYFLLPAAALAGWLVLVQLGAISQADTVVWSLAWWMALALVPVARYCWLHGLTVWLLLALLLPAATVAVTRSFVALGDPAGHYATILDANLLATRLGVTILFVSALAVALGWRDGVGRGLQWGLLVGLGILVLLAAGLLQQALSARAVMVFLPLGLLLLASVTGQRRWLLLALLPPLAYLAPTLLPEQLVFRAHGSVIETGHYASGAADRAFAGRMRMWQAAWSLLPEYWLLGTGLGGFALLYPALRGAEDTTFGAMVHNDWLQLLLEGGVPMFLALLVFALLALFCWGRLGWQLLFAASGESQRRGEWLLGFAALTMVGWILGHALINFPLYDPSLLNVLLVCGVVGMSTAMSRPSLPAQPVAVPPLRRWAARAVWLVILFMWLRVAGFAFTMVTLVDRPPFPGVASPHLDQAAHFDMAVRLRRLGVGFGVPAHIQGAWAAEIWRQNQGQVPEVIVALALEGFAEAERLDPWPEEHYLDHARFREQLGHPFEEHIGILQRGLARNPFATNVWLAYVEHHRRADRFDRATERAVAAGWLPACYFASYMDRDAARELFALLSEEVLAEQGELAQRCELALARPDHIGVVRRR